MEALKVFLSTVNRSNLSPPLPGYDTFSEGKGKRMEALKVFLSTINRSNLRAISVKLYC